jgi:hypothetical protein
MHLNSSEHWPQTQCTDTNVCCSSLSSMGANPAAANESQEPVNQPSQAKSQAAQMPHAMQEAMPVHAQSNREATQAGASAQALQHNHAKQADRYTKGKKAAFCAYQQTCSTAVGKTSQTKMQHILSPYGRCTVRCSAGCAQTASYITGNAPLAYHLHLGALLLHQHLTAAQHACNTSPSALAAAQWWPRSAQPSALQL